MSRFYVVDQQGVPAIIEAVSETEFPPRFLESVRYVFNLISRRIIKDSGRGDDVNYGFLPFIPIARTIYASTPFGITMFGDRAMVWRIGFEADNGFNTVSSRVRELYVLRPEATRASRVSDLYASNIA